MNRELSPVYSGFWEIRLTFTLGARLLLPHTKEYMRIIGLDVGRATVVAAALDHFPANPRAYFNQHRKSFERLITQRQGKKNKQGQAIAEAATKLLAMQPDAIVMNPPGFGTQSFGGFWPKRMAFPFSGLVMQT
jgi:hypothetical protein